MIGHGPISQGARGIVSPAVRDADLSASTGLRCPGTDLRELQSADNRYRAGAIVPRAIAEVPVQVVTPTVCTSGSGHAAAMGAAVAGQLIEHQTANHECWRKLIGARRTASNLSDVVLAPTIRSTP